MSLKQNERYKENLIERWKELSMTWDGKNLWHEREMQEVEGELEELGINVEDL